MNALLLANTTTPLDYPIDLMPKLMLACLLTLNLLAAGYVLGGMILTSLFELRARKQADYNIIAQAIHRCIIPTKLWALVLLVGPVALANLFYLLYLLSTGSPQLGWWGTLFPVGAIAMTVVYMHRFSWPASGKSRDPVHAAVGIGALLMTLVIPAAYLTVINPLPPVPDSFVMVVLESIPRLVHGLLVAVVLAALILAGLLGSEQGPLAGKLATLSVAQARQAILRVALVALFLQVAVGPFVLMTLHLEFMKSWGMAACLGLSVALSLLAMLMLSVDVNAAVQQVGRFLPHVMTLLLLTIISMAMTRQFYRDNAMSTDAAATLARAQSNMEPDDPPAIRAMPGRQLYIAHCNICHYNANMAPTVVDIHQLYADNPDGIVQWAMQPGTRRANYSPMPPQRHVGQARLRQIAQYMLESAEHQIQVRQQQEASLSGNAQATPAASGH